MAGFSKVELFSSSNGKSGNLHSSSSSSFFGGRTTSSENQQNLQKKQQQSDENGGKDLRTRLHFSKRQKNGSKRIGDATIIGDENDETDDSTDRNIRFNSSDIFNLNNLNLSSEALDALEKQRHEKPEVGGLKSIFRAASLLGLFPVSGLRSTDASEAVQLKPCSLQLLASLVCLMAVLVLEFLGLVHIFIFGKDEEDYRVSQIGYIVQNGSLASDIAPIIHYGTTLLALIMLLKVARVFPNTPSHVLDTIERRLVIQDHLNKSTSACGTALIVLAIVIINLTQAVAGTLFTTIIDVQNDTATNVELEAFFSKYAIGTHNFVNSFLEDSFVAGLITFVISNYTIIVWTVCDLTLILLLRNLVTKIANFNANNEWNPPRSESDLELMRENHWLLCILVQSLSQSGLNWLLFSLYLASGYFLWMHLLSLVFPAAKSTFLWAYHVWAAFRQVLRLCLVTFYGVRIPEELHGRPLLTLMGFPPNLYGRTDTGRLRDQCQLFHFGFCIGPRFFPLSKRSMAMFVILLATLFVANVQIEREKIDVWSLGAGLLPPDEANSMVVTYTNLNSLGREDPPVVYKRTKYLNIVQW